MYIDIWWFSEPFVASEAATYIWIVIVVVVVVA